MTADEGMDVCGRCEIFKTQAVAQTAAAQHVYSRRKRDLGHIMKRAVTGNKANNTTAGGDECPCEIEEERDACGVCKPIRSKYSNGNAHL